MYSRNNTTAVLRIGPFLWMESSYTKSESPPSFHQTRPTNVSDKQREKEAQINFPPPHDPVWKEVNEELKVALPQAFPHSRLRSRKINDFSSRLDLWLHKFCKQRFGLKPPPKNLSPSSKLPKQNKHLEELRKKKKTCRAAYKALVKDGLQGSEEAVYILSKWKLLLRQHNRLRLNLIQVRQLCASKKAAACFRKDPNKFAGNHSKPLEIRGTPPSLPKKLKHSSPRLTATKTAVVYIPRWAINHDPIPHENCSGWTPRL